MGLAPLLACSLIALDKNPGVRPIGVCEAVRCIITKAVLEVTRGDIQESAGSLQLCAGQIAGIEAAVHAMTKSFQDENSEAALLVDASLNRNAALLNVRSLCPAIATILTNAYRDTTDLFVDGSTLLSQEGTTQGGPLAMPLYAIATLPLIRSLNADVKQVWYADYVSACGKIQALRSWWDKLVSTGPAYGYNVNALKTWLVVKESYLSKVFQDTGVNVTTEGRPYLGPPLGTEEFTTKYVSDSGVRKLTNWRLLL